MDQGTTKQTDKRLTKSRLYKRVFSGEDGSKVLQDLMANHYMAGTTLTSDSHITAFNEGQRNVVLRILKLVKEDIGAIEKRIERLEEDFYNDDNTRI